MNAPSYLTDYPALHTLYKDLTAALTSTSLAPHAEHLAFQSVIHATAWLSADLPESPYHATDEEDFILYRYTDTQNTVPALDAHLAALIDGHSLTRAGHALFSELNNPDGFHLPRIGFPSGSSLWLNHLQLLTRYGLTFDQRFRIASDAA